MLLFFQFFFLRTHLFPEDLRELRVSEGEGPEAEVGRRVADHPEHELDGLNGLVDDDLAEVVLLLPVPSSAPSVAVVEGSQLRRRVVDELFL